MWVCETYGYWSKPWHLVNPKIAGKWMFIPLELIIIGFDPPPYVKSMRNPFEVKIHRKYRISIRNPSEHPQQLSSLPLPDEFGPPLKARWQRYRRNWSWMTSQRVHMSEAAAFDAGPKAGYLMVPHTSCAFGPSHCLWKFLVVICTPSS